MIILMRSLKCCYRKYLYILHIVFEKKADVLRKPAFPQRNILQLYNTLEVN